MASVTRIGHLNVVFFRKQSVVRNSLLIHDSSIKSMLYIGKTATLATLHFDQKLVVSELAFDFDDQTVLSKVRYLLQIRDGFELCEQYTGSNRVVLYKHNLVQTPDARSEHTWICSVDIGAKSAKYCRIDGFHYPRGIGPNRKMMFRSVESGQVRYYQLGKS